MTEQKQWRYTGPKRYVEYKEAAGKTVEHLRYWHSPQNGQMVSIHFTDGMRISIQIEPLLRVTTDIDLLKEGNLELQKTYRPIMGSPIP